MYLPIHPLLNSSLHAAEHGDGGREAVTAGVAATGVAATGVAATSARGVALVFEAAVAGTVATVAATAGAAGTVGDAAALVPFPVSGFLAASKLVAGAATLAAVAAVAAVAAAVATGTAGAAVAVLVADGRAAAACTGVDVALACSGGLISSVSAAFVVAEAD